MKTLTSRMTPIPKFLIPAIFTGALLACAPGLSSSVPGAVVLLIWILADCAIVWWTLPIKQVRIVGDDFWISNYFRQILVPQSSLRRIEEDLHNSTPNLRLYFGPPTSFGGMVRLIPPAYLFGNEGYDEVLALLKTMRERQAPPGGQG